MVLGPCLPRLSCLSYGITEAAQGNITSTFFLSTESANLGVSNSGFLVSRLPARSRVGRGWWEEGSYKDDFQKQQRRDEKQWAAGGHMLSAEGSSPPRVLRKAGSASPWVGSCWPPEAHVM